MYTLSEPFKLVKFMKILLMIWIPFMLSEQIVLAQPYPIRVNVVVVPPYSTRISDYINTPNKIIVSVMNLSAGPLGKSYDVYLLGSISCDAGVSVTTDPSYVPPRPITLSPGQTYMLSVQDVQELYDANHLVYHGTSEQQIMQAGGFPEGLYTICVRAYDFHTKQPLSDNNPSGCTSFNARNLEVPIITKPVCNDTVEDSFNNFIFSWIPPAGAPPTTMYRLRIVELLSGQQIPPDAFYTTPPNYAFETTTPAPVFVYTSALPPLSSGRTYAFAVQAFDTKGNAFFRNNGWSGICNFLYYKRVKDTMSGPPKVIPGSIVKKPPQQAGNTTVNGRIHYRFHDRADTHPMKHIRVCLKVVYVVKNASSTTHDGTVSHSDEVLVSPNFSDVKFGSDNGKIKASDYTADDGDFTLTTTLAPDEKFGLVKQGFSTSFNIKFPPLPVSLDPLRIGFDPRGGMNWDEGMNYLGGIDGLSYGGLMNKTGNFINYAGLLQGQDNSGSGFQSSFQGTELKKLLYGNIKGKQGYGSGGLYQGGQQKLASLSGTNYDLGSVSGDLYRYLRLVVDNDYFYSPNDDLAPEIDKTLEIPGTLVGYVNASNLAVKVYSDNTASQAAGSGAGIAGIKVEIGRIPAIPDDVPAEEGQNLGRTQKTESSAGCILVSEDETGMNPKGLVTFKDLVYMKSVHEDPYMVFVSTGKRKGVFNYLPDNRELWHLGLKPGFNSDFSEMTDTVSFTLKPDLPRIAGRVMYKNYAIEGARCRTSISPDSAYSDQDGYFEINNLDILKSNATLTITKYGYEDKLIDTLGMLQKGRQFWSDDIELFPWGFITGNIFDADGNPVEARVKIDELPFNATNLGESLGKDVQKFLFRAPSGHHTLHVVPLSAAYMEASFDVTLNKTPDDQPPQDLGEFRVSKNMHRIRIFVYHPESAGPGQPFVNKGVPNCMVGLEGNVKKTGQSGIADFEFESPSCHFRVRVTPPDTPPYYITLQADINNQPSAFIKEYDFEMKEGKSLHGIVQLSPGLDGFKGAKVFISGSGSGPELSSVSGEGGWFTIRGIPSGLDKVMVTVFKQDPAITYVGESKEADLSSPNTRLTLTRLDDIDLTSIMGFPAEITTYHKNPDGTVKVSGRLIPVENQQFRPADPDLRLDFSDLVLRKSERHDARGTAIAEPVEGLVKTDNHSIPLKTMYGYNLIQMPAYSAQLTKHMRLQVTKGPDGNGQVRGNAHILKNSFSMPASILDYKEAESFYLFDPSAGSRSIITLAGKGTVIPYMKYGLCSESGSSMELLLGGFSSTTGPSGSYLDGENIVLSLEMKTKLKGGTTLKLDAGLVTMNREKVKDFGISHPQDIQFGEKWTLHTDQLSWKSSRNGFTGINTTLRTGFASIPVKSMGLSAGDLTLDGFTIGKLELANTVPVTMDPQAECWFYYDPKVGEKAGPHYVIKIIGKDVKKPVAGINAADIHSNSPLQIGSIQVLDNDEQLYAGLENSPAIILYDVFKLKVVQLTGHRDFFTLTGPYSLGLPGIPEYQSANLNYLKQSGTNLVFANFDALEIHLDGPGNVVFRSKGTPFSDTIYPGSFQCRGIITMTDKGLSHTLDATLHKEREAGYIKVEPETQFFRFGSGQRAVRLNNINGEMRAGKQAWDNFWFRGTIANALNAPQKSETEKFIVTGSINSSGNTIGVDNLHSPIGDVSLTFNFETNTLHGYLDLHEYPLCGFTASGAAEMEFGASGWYLAGTVNMVTPDPIIIQQITAGLIFGNTTELGPDLQSMVLKNAKNKTWPSAVGNSLKGFFFTGYKSVFPPISVDDGIKVGDAFIGYKLTGEAGLDARYWMDFGEGATKMGFGIMFYGQASAYMGTYTGTLCPYISGGCDIGFGIENGWYDFSAKQLILNGGAYINLQMDAGTCFGPTCCCCRSLPLHKRLGCRVTIEAPGTKTFETFITDDEDKTLFK